VTLFSQVITSPLKARLGRIIGLHGLCASMKNQCAARGEQSLKILLRALRAEFCVHVGRHRQGVDAFPSIAPLALPRHGSEGEKNCRLYRFLEKGKKLFLFIA